MWLTYAIVSAIIMGLGSFIITVGTKRKQSISYMFTGLYLSGAIGFCAFIQMQQQWAISSELLIAGVCIGLGSVFSNVFFSKAILQGPASLTGPLSNLNIIFVILLSILLFGETLGVTEIIAVALLLISSMLLPFDPNESLSIKNKRWYLFITLTILFMFVLNAGLKVTQSIGLNNTLVLFYAYCFSLISFALNSAKSYFVSRQPMNDSLLKANKKWMLSSFSIGLFAGIFSFAAMQTYTYALDIGPASIVVPIFASRGILVMFLCQWFFKEKMSPFQKLSMTCLFSGLFLVV